MSEEGKKKPGCNWVVILIAGLVGIPVLITIVAVLAAVAVPVYSVIQERAVQTKALANAKQIHLALAQYAMDHDGAFPGGVNDANAAYRQLFASQMVDESMFYVPGSAYHKTLPAGQTRPDGDIGESPMFNKALERGENHWAYVSGLSNQSESNLPIIADGFSQTPGVYSDDPMEKGGVWVGEAAIIVRVDGSAKMEKPDAADFRIYEKRSGQKTDIFSVNGIDPAQILNPQ
ncbi:MAG: hypothetical protein R3F19_34330 [Verrucomicrobiales bacterium]